MSTPTIPDAGTFTTSDGTTLRVLESGPADAPVTVILTHGWTLTQDTWDGVVADLPAAADAPLRTLRFDLRGHGRSDPSPAGTATIERCADDLAELIADRVPEGPIVFAGHSMGGMLLMALAERHPALVAERAVGVAFVGSSCGDLVAPSLGLPKPIAAIANRLEASFRGRLAGARGKRMTRHSRPLRPAMRWLLFGSRPAAADVARTAEAVAACQPASLAGFRTSLAQHDRVDALWAFREVPTAVLVGTSDRLTPYEHARRMATAMPDAQLVVYPGAGHMLPLERKDEVTRRIAQLVRTALRSAR